jgi:cytochrome P450
MTDVTTSRADELDPEWLGNHFDHLSPRVGQALHETLEYLRRHHPVAYSDAHDDGFYVVTGYEDVLRVAQDWQTWSSELGMNVPHRESPLRVLPEQADPPLHREYKKLINYWFRPAVLAGQEAAARALVNGLIDSFIEDGQCEFMSAFARPFPGRVFFEMILHAPAAEVADVTEDAALVATPNHPDQMAAIGRIMGWIMNFLGRRAEQPAHDDVIDAILKAQIDGRPIEPQEIMGMVSLLLFGGLDTTAGVLGQVMIRFCQQPELPALLRERPELIPDAVEELLRLDGSFVAIGRTATRDTEIGGVPIPAGKRALLFWASANRDETEFPCPHAFDLNRASNRHIAFGAGPHRCAGSNLARMNLRIAVAELTRRLTDLRLDQDPASIDFHSANNRLPRTVQIAFTPGRREL